MMTPAYIGGTELLDPVQLLTRLGVQGGQHVADFGCGVTGHFILPAARMVGSEGRAYAVDVQQSVLRAVEDRATQEGLTNLEVVWSDVERMGATRIPAASLDAVLIVNTLFLTSKRDRVLAEAARLLKSGGSVLIVEWKPGTSAVGPALHQRIGHDAIRTAARSAGFAEREAFDAGKYHFGLVFTKN